MSVARHTIRPNPRLLCAIAACILAAVASRGAAAQPDLNGGADSQVATAGYYTLSWSADEGGNEPPVFQLVESRSRAFEQSKVIYEGIDLATTMSGVPDGTYHYRVRVVSEGGGEPASWSNVHTVVVDHHSLGRAFAFLAIGLVVFSATVAMIVAGHRTERDESKRSL